MVAQTMLVAGRRLVKANAVWASRRRNKLSTGPIETTIDN